MNKSFYQHIYSKRRNREIKFWLLKTSLSIIFLTILAISAQAQDVIIKTDGDEIKAKVEEIGTLEVKYKRFDNEDGPSYSILKSEVFVIKYANGTKELLGGKVSSTAVQPTPAPVQTVVHSAPTSSVPRSFQTISMEGFTFRYENMRVSPKDVSMVMKKNGMPEAAKEFEKGLKLYPSVSRPLIGVGIPFFLAGTVLSILGGGIISSAEENFASSKSTYSSYESSVSTGSALMGVGIPLGGIGLGCWITGAVLKGAGLKKIRNSVEKYNASIK